MMDSLKEKILSVLFGVSVWGAGKVAIKELASQTSVVNRLSTEMSHLTDNIQIKATRSGHSHNFDATGSAAQTVMIRGLIRSFPSWRSLVGDDESVQVDHDKTWTGEFSHQNRPNVVDLRYWDNPIQDQGKESSCTAYATAAAMENLLYQKQGIRFKLSEKNLWQSYQQTRIDKALATVSGAQAAGVKVTLRGNTSISSNLLRVRIPHQTAARLTTGTSGILNSIAAHKPVIIGVKVTDGLVQSPSGWIDPYTKPSFDGHAMTVVGYRLYPTEEHKSYLIVRNSWGTAWGDKGYGYLPLKYCELHGCVAYTIENVDLFEVQ